MMRVGEMPKCGCGRTRDPNGGCDGSHGTPCNCRKCLQHRGEMLTYSTEHALVNMPGPNPGFYGMVVCAKCGNKRCPHATDHNNVCTNSNETGQPGSIYG